ncbi:MAG: hypothetical protein MET45_21215 [Nostoc sp. LLA-1]|nr:hypothetical protein [Cyanocohniella sp. LLY]
MNIQDFESNYRAVMAETLNELQTAVLLIAQLQRKLDTIGNSVQIMSEKVEEYITNETDE